MSGDHWPGLLPGTPAARDGMAEDTFTRWLGDVLHQQFADALHEPVPQEWVELLGGTEPPGPER